MELALQSLIALCILKESVALCSTPTYCLVQDYKPVNANNVEIGLTEIKCLKLCKEDPACVTVGYIEEVSINGKWIELVLVPFSV